MLAAAVQCTIDTVEPFRPSDVMEIPSTSTHTPVEPLDSRAIEAQHHNGEDQLQPLSASDAVEDVAAARIQRLCRCRQARRHLCALLNSVFEKFYDADSGLYYYFDKRTQETTWEKPKLLRSNEDVRLAPIYDQDQGMTLVDVEQSPESPSARLQGSELPKEGEDEDEEDEDDEGGGATAGYSPQEIELVRHQFDHYDVDHSGSISAEELLKLLQTLGEPVTLASVQEMIRQVDANSNGEVEFDEFLQILRRQKQKNRFSAPLELAIMFGPKELEKLKRQFMLLDLDGSGSIDQQEIQVLIKKLGRRVQDFDIKAMLSEVDSDGSGSIGFNEFLQIVANMMRDKDSRSGFAALLDLGIAQGLLNGLDEVMQASQKMIYEWWNADAIAEQKRLEAKRERRRKQEMARRAQLEKDQAVLREHQAKLAAVEAARHKPIDGLLHEIEFPGDGVNFPNVGQYARVHYVGTFPKTGEVFESTRKRGGALEFRVGAGHLIQGFDLVLQRMSIGETARVTMAPMLAYGVKGRPPRIPPNATLVFKIELISIQEKLGLALDVA